MIDARYHGIDEKGRPYTLTAATAQQDGPERVNLTIPKGDITLEDGTWLMLQAKQGVFMQHINQLDLSHDVTLYRDDGTTLVTASASIDLKNGAAAGAEPVHAEGPFGTLDAQGFTLVDKGANIQFAGPAHLVLNGATVGAATPSQRRKPTPPPPPPPPPAPGRLAPDAGRGVAVSPRSAVPVAAGSAGCCWRWPRPLGAGVGLGAADRPVAWRADRHHRHRRDRVAPGAAGGDRHRQCQGGAGQRHRHGRPADRLVSQEGHRRTGWRIPRRTAPVPPVETGLTPGRRTDTGGNEVYRVQAEGHVHIYTQTDQVVG